LAKATGAGVAACGVWGVGVEPKSIQTTFVDMPIGGLPRRWDGMRVAVLADLHASRVVAAGTIRHAFELAARLDPQVVTVVGDWVSDSNEYIGDLEAAVTAVPRRIPLIGTLGNHDYVWEHTPAALSQELTSRLTAAGVRMLRDEVYFPGGPGDGLAFLGLEDLIRGRIDSNAFAKVPAGAKTVVLAHNPDCADTLAQRPWDVMVSGHTHGGQVVIPGLRPFHLPVKNTARYAGLYRLDQDQPGRLLYVNRGIGSYFHVRVNCPPEVTCLTLRSV
jgi:predicted MPP superfamily phosphohydrolase